MPGKRVVRIGVFRSGSGPGIYCSFYVERPETSGELIRHCWCEIKPEQYEHMADVVNEAASQGNGVVEAHTAIPGFVWTQRQ